MEQDKIKEICHSAIKNYDNSTTLYHSDTYLGEDYSDGIKHWKYIKKEKLANGKTRYYYTEQEMNEAARDVADKFTNAMRESNKYSERGTLYPSSKTNGKTIHYQVERTDYSEEKANKAWKDHGKASRKYQLQKLVDVPKRILSKGAVWVANLFNK